VTAVVGEAVSDTRLLVPDAALAHVQVYVGRRLDEVSSGTAAAAGSGFMPVSLATIEMAPQGGKTALRFTEQAVFVDGQDGNESRRQGTAYLLEQIAANLPD
jgi:hypothetical protein